MRNLFLGSAALIAIGVCVSARAADMPVKAPPFLPEPPYNWSGAYVGANVGGAWTSGNRTRANDPPRCLRGQLLSRSNSDSPNRVLALSMLAHRDQVCPIESRGMGYRWFETATLHVTDWQGGMSWERYFNWFWIA
jgi:hypothetical protein